MERSYGTWISVVASAVLVALLLAAFVGQSFGDVLLYYNFGTTSPLLAGVFASGVVLIFALIRLGRLSEAVGGGVALGLALVAVLVVVVWAFTGRVDVFLAPGWAFPAHRWILVGVALLVLLGTGVRVWDLQADQAE